jgi:RNA polymerase sigma factor (sigma-70 family)
MAPSPSENSDLFARLTAGDETGQKNAETRLLTEVLMHLQQRKLGLGEHDLKNVASHVLEAIPPTEALKYRNWDALLEHALKVADNRADEEKMWLDAYPQLKTETLSVLIAKRFPLSEQDLLAVTDDSILKVREKNPQLVKTIEDLKRYLFTIATNAALDKIKANQADIRGGNITDSIEEMPPGKETAAGDDQAPGFDVASDTHHPGESLVASEKRSLLMKALAKLPKKYAQVLVDLHWHGLKHEEVAKKRGLKIGSIGVYNKRAMQMLAVVLATSLGLFALMQRNATLPMSRYNIQLVKVGDAEDLMRGVTAPKSAATNELVNPELVTALQKIFGTNASASTLTTDDLHTWTNSWAKAPQKLFKVAYDPEHKTVTVLANNDTNAVQMLSLHVESDAELEADLPAIRDAIAAYLKHPQAGFAAGKPSPKP